MKNNVSKYYMTAFYLCTTFMMFAQPGTDNGTGTLDGDGDVTPAAPIDDYVLVLALVGLFLVFMKLRAVQNRKINS